jgi:hypothetical protein
MSNHKHEKINQAKKQFTQDVQQDKDYIEYKKRCLIDSYTSYGSVLVSQNIYMLSNLGPSCETLIREYLKQFKKKI